MARRRSPDPFDIRHTVRIRQSDEALVQAYTRAAAMTVSELFRHMLHCQQPPPRTRHRFPGRGVALLAELLAAIGKIGSNINQLARVANMGGWPEAALLEQAAADIRWIRRTLMQALGIRDPDAPEPQP